MRSWMISARNTEREKMMTVNAWSFVICDVR